MPFVYFIHEETNDPPSVFKVGKTSIHPADRCSQLQTGNPRRLIIYRWIEVDSHSEVEESIHAEIAQLHIRGEWFKITTEFADTLCALAASLHPEAVISGPYPKWTEEDIIAVQNKRIIEGKYRGDYSPRTARKKKKEYWAKVQPIGFSDD